jgi:hypothetical protein
MSKSTMLGWLPLPVRATCRMSRFWVRYMVEMRNVPRPMEVTRMSVWFWGR